MEGIKIDATSVLVGASAGCVAGALLGYILARRAFNARLEDELAAARHHYRLRAEAASASADAVERPVPAVGDGLGNPGDKRVDDPYGNDIPELEGLGEEAIAEEDVRYGAELAVSDAAVDIPWPPANRIRNQPYVISSAEFAEGVQTEDSYHQTLTVKWYNGDKVLLDDKDQPIPDIRRTTGHLSKAGFGGVSGDPKIRYVRNEKLEVDFEIVFHEGSYVTEVLNYGNPRNRPR